jgi:hypothetical protein
MKNILPHVAVCVLVSSTFAVAAPKKINLESSTISRFDRTTARQLNDEEVTHFGPQAGRFKYDERMIRAAEIAKARARKHSTKKCWRSVKDALLAAKALPTRPDTLYAKQAAGELSREYGFKKLSVKDPWRAPIGSVLVYGGRGAGHVEFRTRTGFVSDFFSVKPSARPFLGAYVIPRT